MFRMLVWISVLNAAAISSGQVIFAPSPVPCPKGEYTDRYGYGELPMYYQQQLRALSRCRWGSCVAEEQASDLYYRKADLMPPVHVPSAHSGPYEKGTILIIPKKMLNNPTKNAAEETASLPPNPPGD